MFLHAPFSCFCISSYICTPCKLQLISLGYDLHLYSKSLFLILLHGLVEHILRLSCADLSKCIHVKEKIPVSFFITISKQIWIVNTSKLTKINKLKLWKKYITPICFVVLHVKYYMALSSVPFGVVREPQISRAHIYVCVLYSIDYKNYYIYDLFSNIFFSFCSTRLAMNPNAKSYLMTSSMWAGRLTLCIRL